MAEPKKNLVNILVIVVGILAISFSTYQTSIGYKEAVGSFRLSIVLSLLISLSMIVLLISLKQKYYERQGVFWTLVLYTIFASISIFANFNTFFTGFIRDDKVSREIETLNSKYSELQTITNKRIEQTDGIKEQVNRVKALKEVLKKQIFDEANPGYGYRAKLTASDIAKALNIEAFSEPYGTPTQEWNSLSGQIDNVLERTVGEDLKMQMVLTDEINSAIKGSKSEFTKARSTRTIEDDEIALNLQIPKYNNLCSRLNGFINDENVYKYEPYETDVVNLGKIPYALSQASMPKFKTPTLIALLIAFIIDFFVPLLIFAVTPRKKKKRNNRSMTNANMPVRIDKKEGVSSVKFDEILKRKSK